ncbi:unnamed protein product [marine sediment metagenome]|uniref:Uncharacterized protein n=1 Tax=marine sediment metagenome TaxID=412755 RepID=X1L6B7_9ZZZZ
MPNPGQILCYKDFEFEDGSKKDKLFVVLNDSDRDSLCIVLKTTSQSKHYEGVVRGCNPDNKVFFVPTNWEQCFTLDTYIQLPQIFQLTSDELLVGDISRKIYISTSLSVDCLRLLKDCLRNFRDDIPPQHWKLIFK